MLDSLKYFSEPKNFLVLACLFLYMQLIYFDYYVFVFLSEKFTEFKIQHVIYVTVMSSMVGYVILTLWLTQARRRFLNFLLSGGIFCLSLAMLVASLTLPKHYTEVLGFASMCKKFSPSVTQVFFKILGAFGYAYCFLYNVELFPSHVRGFTIGVLAFLFNMGSTAIPYLGILTDWLGLHFLSCLAPFGLMGLVASCYLPETQKQILKN